MMVEIPVEMFSKVETCVNAACKAAADSQVNYCANMGDLGCVDLVWVYGNDGDSWWQATIEEASPHDYKLRAFITAYCREQGFHVEVITEW